MQLRLTKSSASRTDDRSRSREYGDQTGEPVFFCHGWPSSRTMAELTDTAARDLGLRIISPDRPGIRDSSFHAEQETARLAAAAGGTRGLDWASASFEILGISGGAPYALAAAWAMPERVRAIAVVSGAPPLADLADRGGLLRALSLVALFLSTPSRVAAAFFSRRAAIFVDQVSDPFPAAAAQASPALRRQRDARCRGLRGLFRKPAPGLAGVGRWPHGRCRNLRAAVGISAGGNPRARSGSGMARRIAAFTGSSPARSAIACRTDDPHWSKSEGHYSLPIRHMHEILADLISA